MTSDLIMAATSGAVIALCALIAALTLRDARESLVARVLACLALSVAALELTTGPVGPSLPSAFWLFLRVLGGFNVALLWLFCLLLLSDGKKFRGWVAGVFCLFCIGPLATMFAWPETPQFVVFGVAVAIAPFVAIAHIVYIAIIERRGDLVEERLRARFWLPVVLVTAAFVSVAAEFIADGRWASAVRLFGAGLPGVAIIAWWLLALQPDRLTFASPKPASAPVLGAIDPRDQPLLSALQDAMTDGLYREHGLTLEILADRLKAPVHRVRAVINQGLGHRNFAAFVNGYRLRHAKVALADPARGRETVLAIAYESGFAALQTFNRVFKDSEGVTPTAYREKAL